MNETYTLDDILQELNAGIFVAQCTEALKKVALGVVNNNKDGSVTIKLNLSKIGESDSVKVKHTLQYNQPTMRGKMVEDNTTTTPMYVNCDGTLSISPLSQTDVFETTGDSSNVTQFKGQK